MLKPFRVLQAPAEVFPAVAAHLGRGNTTISEQEWAEAEGAFHQTIAPEPTLAEAHYSLAAALDHAGNKAEANKH
jgi:Flp pilus assembly protein TadD